MELRKILVVEDSDLLHRMYGVILVRYVSAGAQLLHAYNGQEALLLLAQAPDVELILLDINMPVMSGLEFLTHCKSNHVFQNIPVIIISTEGKEDDTLRGLQAGARAYLTKPFKANELHDLIARIFALSRPGERVAEPRAKV